MHHSVSSHDVLPADETALVDEGIGTFNDGAAPLHMVQPRSAFARDADGCPHFHLETVGVQAPGFYRRIGHRVGHALNVYPHGIVRHLMRKDDDDGPAHLEPNRRR